MGTDSEMRIQRPTGRKTVLLLPFSLCYALFVVLGDWQGSVGYSNAQNLGRIVLWTAGSFVVLFAVGFLAENGQALLTSALPVSLRWSLEKVFPKRKRRQGHWWIWLLFFLFCLLCYLPYYLMYYPTWFNNDAVWQMEQALGLAAKSNHHPYFHTLIIKIFLTIGYGLFRDYTAAVALYTFFQMALVAAVFGFYLYLMYRRGTRLLWMVLAVFFYALLPVNGMFSICMGKDAWFTAAFLLFVWAVYVCAQVKTDDRRRWLLFFMTGLSVCLLRSNGIFIFLGTAFFLILSWLCGRERRSGKRAGLSFGIRGGYMYLSVVSVLVGYLLWQGPILHALHVEPPDTIESLTMPVQHLLCAYVRGGNLTPEEVAMIDQVAPLERIDDFYNPYLFDMTKNYIREKGNQKLIADNKREYAKLWLRVGLRNPMLYLEAEIRQTAGYYALRIPHEQILYSEYFMVENPFGIETHRKVFSYDDSLAMSEFLLRFQTLYNKVWSLGMNTWILLLCLSCALYAGKPALVYVPCLMLLGSLLLATPVYNEFRYAYGIFAALPLLIEFSFGPVEVTDDKKMV